MATAQVGAAVRIAVDGWSNPIELAGAMLRAGDDDSPPELTTFLRKGALAIKQLHDQVRQSQRDVLLSADEQAVRIIAQQDGHIFRQRKVVEMVRDRINGDGSTLVTPNSDPFFAEIRKLADEAG